MSLTDAQIEEGLRLAGEATPGPWSVSDYACYILGPQCEMVGDECPSCAGFRIRGYGGGLPQEQNAKWIAHAGTHYAAALREVLYWRNLRKDYAAVGNVIDERDALLREVQALREQVAAIDMAFGNALALDGLITLAEKAAKCMTTIRQQEKQIIELGGEVCR